jgi:hypothetical protein
MRTRREVLEMLQVHIAETKMLAKGVNCIVHCFLEPVLNDGIPTLEAMESSVDKESVI